uniref:Uncharacterized protein n=1 Tax=Alexandrium monilatum TaxID=311494 RepID=A0A7S4UQF0_9DINO|mmetsp:Transcript_56984/g.177206  ORF Transcript_56984/g.177206 Transcript_56984/m.177206 type:complete len:243 (+) Transcript_56984:62-790(+)
MLACQCEIDQTALKVRRAAARNQQLRLERSEYERRRAARSQPPPRAPAGEAPSRLNPHRLARAATRTCLAKGILETVSDVPTIVSRGHSGPLRRRKPGVASVLSFLTSDAPSSESPCCTEELLRELRRSDVAGEGWRELLAEAETTASENGGAESEDSLDTAMGSSAAAVQDGEGQAAAQARFTGAGAAAAEAPPTAAPRPREAAVEAAEVAGVVRPEDAGWEVLPGSDCLAVEGAGWSFVV